MPRTHGSIGPRAVVRGCPQLYALAFKPSRVGQHSTLWGCRGRLLSPQAERPRAIVRRYAPLVIGSPPRQDERRPAPGALTALLHQLAREPAGSSEEAPIPLLPGEVVGRFELLREIGRGGFGIVYEARDRELGRLVAFKSLRGGGKPDLAREQLLSEAEAAARLSHPNIVTLFDVGHSERGPYLVFELLRGQSLAQRLAHGPLQ